MTRFMALVLGAALLAGCTGPTFSYSKADSDVADFTRDSNACVQEPRMSWGTGEIPMIVGAGIGPQRQAGRLYRMCMEAHGWAAN
jgi:hypothetical protein